MSNLTDFMEQLICTLDNPKFPQKAVSQQLYREDHNEPDIDDIDIKIKTGKEPKTTNKNMTPEEKKIAHREYLRNYMRSYIKVYVQPEHNKTHDTKRRRKYGTALITSAKIRKNAEKMGIRITHNAYKVKIDKGETDETKSKVCKPESPTNL